MRLFFTLLFLTLGSSFIAIDQAQAADLEDLDSSSSSKRSKKVEKCEGSERC
jgi:hypothetical protein